MNMITARTTLLDTYPGRDDLYQPKLIIYSTLQHLVNIQSSVYTSTDSLNRPATPIGPKTHDQSILSDQENL